MNTMRTCHWHVKRLLKAGIIASVLITSTVNAKESDTLPIITSIEPLEISDYDLDILSRCVMAEAENQGKDGMAYVADVILNRVDNEDFPDSIEDVITQKNQFSSYSDGGMDKHIPSNECKEICRQEFLRRKNGKIIYFRTNEYHKYGTPAFKHGAHYFSTK